MPPEIPVRQPELEPISSPLRDKLTEWQRSLTRHGDRIFVEYVLEGLRSGFRVGFNHSHPLVSARRNMPSAAEHADIIDSYISEEIAGGRMMGPFPMSVQGIHLNRMGVVPKGHTPGRWRIITDLSFPERSSVNEGIDPTLCSLEYTSVEKVATAAMALGMGSKLAKLDVKSAYRLLPVHPTDRPLLGVLWRGAQFVDGMLPFGLRSAPKIFTAVADALEWILRQEGVRYIDHYLDDFILYGPAGSDECARQLELTLHVCDRLGVPLATEKLEGPTERLTFLGIEIDTRLGILRLPDDKLQRVRHSLDEWESRRACTKRELESLIGTLQHACQVVRPGRSFLRRMIDLARIPKRPHHFVRLNQDFRADLRWWRAFLVWWNGRSLIPLATARRCVVTSDASGLWGCGAWCRQSWLQFKWPTTAAHHHISFKELFALLLAAAAWGGSWCGTRVQWFCDNQAAVRVVSSRSCRDRTLMHLLRYLFFFRSTLPVSFAGILHTRCREYTGG